MTARLDPESQHWMSAPAAKAVMAALEAARPGGSRFVGGCVRNALLGEPVHDIDIATQLTPNAITKALQAAGLKAVPTGVEHGTVTAVIEGEGVEVTTLRKDVSTDGRRAVVAFTEDWTEDSLRRDFTFNALYADADGTIHDPQGGLADLEARRVVFVGEADDRIREDYLRILRFFRFFAWYGEGRPERDGLMACIRHKEGLEGLSAERVWSELKRLLEAPDPRIALRWMHTGKILEVLLGHGWGIDGITDLVVLEQAQGWAPDPMLRLIAMTPNDARRAADFADRLKLSKAERGRLLDWALLAEGKWTREETGLDWSEAERARALYRTGVQPMHDRAALAWAAARGKSEADDAAYAGLLGYIEAWEKPVFPVTGKDLLARGETQGAALGMALNAMEARWIDSGFTLSKEELLRE